MRWRHSPARAGLAVAAAALALLATTAPAMAQDANGASLEYAVKAIYLYKLAAFVQWPKRADTPTEFDLCVAGAGPFGGLLDDAARGQTVEGRPIMVRRFLTMTGNPGCDIAFIAGSPAQSVAALLAVLRGTPVLTVTDGAADPADKGILNFVLVSGRVRFEIDDAAASANGLTLSSKLLSLALNARTRAPQ